MNSARRHGQNDAAYSEELLVVEQEIFGKMMRSLRIRNLEEQDQEEQEKSEYPMLVKTFRRVMEKQVMQSPPKKRERTRTPQGLTGSMGHHGEYLGQFGPATPRGLSGASTRPSTSDGFRPRSAPSQQRNVSRDSLRVGSGSPMLSATGDKSASGVGIKTQPSPFFIKAGGKHDQARDPEKTQEDMDEEGNVLSAFEMLKSKDTATRRQGAKELTRITMTPWLATNIANSGVLVHICDLVVASSTEIDSNFYNLVCGLLFKAGSMPECHHQAAHALSTILGRRDDDTLNSTQGGRAASASTPRRPRPHSAAVTPSRPNSAAKSTRSLGATNLSTSGTPRNGDVSVTGEKKVHGDKVSRDVLFLGPIALPCKTISEQDSVGKMETGSMMYVYPPENERFKVFEAYVQLLPDGSLFVGGVRQNVKVEGAVRGCSDHVKSRFNLTSAQRKGCIRLQGRPQPGFSGQVPDSGLITLDLRLHSVSDALIWIKGVGALTEAFGYDDEEMLGQQDQQEERAEGSSVTMPFDGIIPERDGPASYEGERDRAGNPSGFGSVTWSKTGHQLMGSFKMGMPDGLGLLNMGNTGRFVGQWEGGVVRGHGVMFTGDGGKYEGSWAGDCREGRGLEYQSRHLVYAGGYRGGARHGDGIILDYASATEGETHVDTCEYFEGELVRQDVMESEKWYEELEVYKAAEKEAKLARDVAMEVAKLLKTMHDSQDDGAGSERSRR